MQRQYTGTAGRIENSQVAVYLTYATSTGHALIDRALYLPKSWSDDPDRRAEAGVPDDVAFATKPALAKELIVRALEGGAVAPRVAGDEVCGADPGLRKDLEQRQVGYVLAVSCSHPVTTAAGKQRADEIAVPAQPCLAAAVRRSGLEGSAVLRLGLDHHRHRHRHRRCLGWHRWAGAVGDLMHASPAVTVSPTSALSSVRDDDEDGADYPEHDR